VPDRETQVESRLRFEQVGSSVFGRSFGLISPISGFFTVSLFGHVFSSRLRLQTRWHVHARVSAFGTEGKLGLVSGKQRKNRRSG
jgi:hypothetical protein